MQITMDERTQAFYKGVGVGSEVFEQTKSAPDYETRLLNFMFYAGRRSADIADEHLDVFVQGVMTRLPAEPEYVIVHDDEQLIYGANNCTWNALDDDEDPLVVRHSKRADYAMPEHGVWVAYDPEVHG